MWAHDAHLQGPVMALYVAVKALLTSTRGGRANKNIGHTQGIVVLRLVD